MLALILIFLAFTETVSFQVVLLNATSTPFEVRFDIPFGVSPKVSYEQLYFFSLS